MPGTHGGHRGIRSPGITDCCEQLCACWEWSPDPLQVQKALSPLSHLSSSDNGCFYAKCRFFFQSLSERLEPLNYVTCLSGKMPSMERERGQPGVLRAGHTTFSSLGAEALVTSHPLTRSRAPFVEDTWGARGPACHPVENPPPYPRHRQPFPSRSPLGKPEAYRDPVMSLSFLSFPPNAGSLG